MKSPIIITFFLSIAVASISGNALAQVGWSPASQKSKVADLRVFNGSQIYGTAVDVTTLSNCSSTNTFKLKLDANNLADETFSMLLTAQTTGREVVFYRTGTCSAGHTEITGVWLHE